MAAGSSSRWDNYMNIPKHLVEIDGEQIIKRTIRLLKEYGISNIYITVPEKGFFGDLGVKEIVGSSEKEIDKFLNAKQHIGATFLWGDCYFTENAIKKIVENEEDLMFFGNPEFNKYTGKPYGEIYAVKTNEEFFKKAIEIEKHRDSMSRCASWELYGYILKNKIPYSGYYPHFEEKVDGMCIKDPDKVSKYFTEINDFTDDFDKPKDYDEWIKRYNEYFLQDAWSKKPKETFTFSYNIMAHPKRKKYIPYLKKKLGNIKVIWDTDNDIFDTRQRCLEDHIKQGKDFGITVQDDAILCHDFKKKAELFVNQIGEREAIYNFYYTMHEPNSKVDKAIRARKNYLQRDVPGIGSEIVFAFPTHLMQEMIDTCRAKTNMSAHAKGIDKDGKIGDWALDERYAKEKAMPTYFSVPSLVDHRVELDSLYYPKGFIREDIYVFRKAWWFYGDVWEGFQKKYNYYKEVFPREQLQKVLYNHRFIASQRGDKEGADEIGEILVEPDNDMIYIINTKNTLNAGSGTDLIFEPYEVKVLKREVAETILRNGDGFKRGS